jgi:hypothetical protein
LCRMGGRIGERQVTNSISLGSIGWNGAECTSECNSQALYLVLTHPV